MRTGWPDCLDGQVELFFKRHVFAIRELTMGPGRTGKSRLRSKEHRRERKLHVASQRSFAVVVLNARDGAGGARRGPAQLAREGHAADRGAAGLRRASRNLEVGLGQMSGLSSE